MSSQPLHSWTPTYKQAVMIQKEMCNQLVLTWDKREINSVGGVDVSFREGQAQAAIVVFSFPDLTPIESAVAQQAVTFPYIPGLLTFREGPVVLTAWEQLKIKPDLLMFDGQGIAHPRGIGIASHLGLWLNCPTIGVAKSRLFGRHEEPGIQRGDEAQLRDERDVTRSIGMVIRTRTNVRPMYISPGHLMDIPHAVTFVLRCCTRYRLPEPTRWAHRVAGGGNFPAR